MIPELQAAQQTLAKARAKAAKTAFCPVCHHPNTLRVQRAEREILNLVERLSR